MYIYKVQDYLNKKIQAYSSTIIKLDKYIQ